MHLVASRRAALLASLALAAEVSRHLE